MTTITKCRAKNPATCWKHGNHDAISKRNILDPGYALATLRLAEKDTEKAYQQGDADLFLESKYAEEVAHLDYDASLDGIDKLEKSLFRSDMATRLENQKRLRAAKERREQYLKDDAVELNRAEKISQVLADNNRTGLLAAKDLNKAQIREINSIPHQNPVLVVGPNGYYIASAATTYRADGKPSIFSKNYFLSTDMSDRLFLHFTEHGAESTKDHQFATLSPDYKIQAENLLPETAKKVDPWDSGWETSPYGRYAIVGSNYYREFEGTLGRRKEAHGHIELEAAGVSSFVKVADIHNYYKL